MNVPYFYSFKFKSPVFMGLISQEFDTRKEVVCRFTVVVESAYDEGKLVITKIAKLLP